MKRILVALFVLSFCFACKKQNVPSGSAEPRPVDSTSADTGKSGQSPKLLSTIVTRDFMIHQLRIDSLIYDSRQRIKGYAVFQYDSAQSNVLTGNTFISTFNYNSTDPFPVSIDNGGSHTILEYDELGRIILDSPYSDLSFHFQYGRDTIFMQRIYKFPAAQRIDTMIFKNSYLDKWKHSDFGPPCGSPECAIMGEDTFTYGSFDNPLSHLGALALPLYCLRPGDLDFFSPTLFNEWKSTNAFHTWRDWSEDTNGNLICQQKIMKNGITHFTSIEFRFR